MTSQQKKLWQLVAEKTKSNLDARMVYDELLKKLKMSEETIILSLVETDNGIEVHLNEKAYENFAVIGLIEKIKFDLLQKPFPNVQKVSNSNEYDA